MTNVYYPSFDTPSYPSSLVARVEAAKAWLGTRYLLAEPVSRKAKAKATERLERVKQR